MQDDDSALYDRAVEHPRNPRCRLDAEFEKPGTHGAGVGHAQIWTERFHSLGIPQETGDKGVWESEELILDALVVEGDGPSHDDIIAYLLSLQSQWNDG